MKLFKVFHKFFDVHKELRYMLNPIMKSQKSLISLKISSVRLFYRTTKFLESVFLRTEKLRITSENDKCKSQTKHYLFKKYST